MPGKHVRFNIPSTPLESFSISTLPSSAGPLTLPSSPGPSQVNPSIALRAVPPVRWDVAIPPSSAKPARRNTTRQAFYKPATTETAHRLYKGTTGYGTSIGSSISISTPPGNRRSSRGSCRVLNSSSSSSPSSIPIKTESESENDLSYHQYEIPHRNVAALGQDRVSRLRNIHGTYPDRLKSLQNIHNLSDLAVSIDNASGTPLSSEKDSTSSVRAVPEVMNGSAQRDCSPKGSSVSNNIDTKQAVSLPPSMPPISKPEEMKNVAQGFPSNPTVHDSSSGFRKWQHSEARKKGKDSAVAGSASEAMDVDEEPSGARDGGGDQHSETDPRPRASPSAPFARLPLESPAPSSSSSKSYPIPSVTLSHAESSQCDSHPQNSSPASFKYPGAPPPIRPSSSFLARVLNSPEHSWTPFSWEQSKPETSNNENAWSSEVDKMFNSEIEQPDNEDHAMDDACVSKEIKKEALEGMENQSHSTDPKDAVVDQPEQDELPSTSSPPHSPSRMIDEPKDREDVEVDSEDCRSDSVSLQTSTPHQPVPPVIVEPQSRVGAAETISFTAEIQEQSGRPDTDVNASPALTTKSPHPSPLPSPAQQCMPLSSPLSSPISSLIEPTITIDVQRSDNGIPAEQRASASSDMVPELVPSTSISPDQSVRDVPPGIPPSVWSSLSPLSSPVSVNGHDDDVKSIRCSPIRDDPGTVLESKTEPPSPLPEPAAFHLVQRPGITPSIMNCAVQKKQESFDCFHTADSSPTLIGERPDPPDSRHLTIGNTKYLSRLHSGLHSPDWVLSMHHDWGWLSRSGGDKASLPERRKRDTANLLSHLLAEWAASPPGAFNNANGFGIHGSSFANAQNVHYTINHYWPAPTSNSGPSSYELHLQQQNQQLQKQLEDERTIRKQNEARNERMLSNIRQSLHRLEARIPPGPEPPPNEAENEDSYFDIMRAVYLQKLVTQDDRTTFVTEMIAFMTPPLRNPSLAPAPHPAFFQRLPNVKKHQLWMKTHDVAITSTVYPTADISTIRMGDLSLDLVLREGF
ncbi:hypothetical protein D9758_014914 [Tetrapyrgos nigripes]|uniref:Uncharacterized protein n=1 Tax=Tetrapyrgos nigripes TaxID=182062 RepID=A0A8H5C9B8_9AGAR|nr:hypothetical protein D9758_014914 [Tetrapyrgos nigripes]